STGARREAESPTKSGCARNVGRRGHASAGSAQPPARCRPSSHARADARGAPAAACHPREATRHGRPARPHPRTERPAPRDRVRTKRSRAVAQNLGQRIGKSSWLRELENISLSHGVSLLRWRSGGLEHPHDTPPYPFTPSPTFAHSSQDCRGAELVLCAKPAS